MHVIWHDTPFEKTIPFTITQEEFVLQKRGTSWITQDTRTMTSVFVTGNALVEDA